MTRYALVVLTLGWMALHSSFIHAGIGAENFIRGDANQDGSIDISDPVFILNALFAGGAQPNCPDAADANDDGSVNVADGVFVLNFLFVAGSAAPSEPFPIAGPDLTPDGMLCGTPCVDIAEFEDLFTMSFPVTQCLPMGMFSEAGVDVDFCDQTTSSSCLGAAGCDATIALDTFSYDPATLTGTATLVVTVDPIGITYDSFLFSGSCDGSLITDVVVDVVATGIVVAPGVTEITDVTVELMITNTDLDLSQCGAIGFLAGFFIDTLIPSFEDQFEQAAADQIVPLIIGTQLCTP